jgi:hypothetical protein
MHMSPHACEIANFLLGVLGLKTFGLEIAVLWVRTVPYEQVIPVGPCTGPAPLRDRDLPAGCTGFHNLRTKHGFQALNVLFNSSLDCLI